MDSLRVGRLVLLGNKLHQLTLPFMASMTPITSAIQSRGFAARRGTRAKMAKKKVKVEVKKIGFIPHNLRAKAKGVQGPVVSRRLKDEHKNLPCDDVWLQRFYRWKVFSVEEAVQCFRETYHPEIFNVPNANLRAFIELDMRAVKNNKYVDPFSKIASIPHPFDHGEDRSVLVFCKTPEIKNDAESAGASLVADTDAAKKIEKGDVVLPDFQYFVAHPNILPEIVGLRGLLKKKFPSAKNGTLGMNIAEIVRTIRTGIQYTAMRDERELDYGFVDVIFGRLDMETTQLKENLISLLENIQSVRPKRDGPFITRVVMTSPPSAERLKLNLASLLGEEESLAAEDSDSDDERPVAKAKAA